MKYIVLCGGLGNRVSNSVLYSKPLNLINGVHSICYCMESLPYDEIYFILNKKLIDYNFDTLLPHMNIKKNIHYVYLDVDTRGPVETAYLGIKKIGFSEDEQLCFIDNDTIYGLCNVVFPTGNFMGYSTILDDNVNRPYCFIQHEQGVLTDILEKNPISSTYACGIYGFGSVGEFLNKSRELLSTVLINEYFFSNLFKHMLKNSESFDSESASLILASDIEFKSAPLRGAALNSPIQCIEVANCVCVGTFEDIESNILHLPFKKKRFCFDIDNTLLKYRTGDQTYRDCTIIEKNVYLLRKLKEMGHTIILYTARGMKTAKNNLGLSLKNVAKDTFDNLEANGIDYDEIYFGKPDADFYIDDKGYNAYLNIFDALGFHYLNEEYAKTQISSNTTNKFNYLYKTDQNMTKCGTIDSIQGEVFFYNTIKNKSISSYFPKFYSYEIVADDTFKIKLEYIHGFTLFELLKNGLFTDKYIQMIIESLDVIHHCPQIPVNISKDDVYDNYIKKLVIRTQYPHNYPFDNTQKIVEKITAGIKSYIYSDKMEPVSVVHGDSWFSNTILTVRNRIIFLDMKGNINGTFTTNGDPLTDFGKMLQSLLGFDYIVNNIHDYDVEHLTFLRRTFLLSIMHRFRLKDIYTVTACLIAKTFYFLEVDISVRRQLWHIIERLCDSDGII